MSLIGILLAIAAAGGWAHNSIVYTFAGRRVGSNTTAHIRLWFALAMSLLIHTLVSGRLIPVIGTPISLAATVVSGILGYFLADLFIFKAFLYIGPRDTMLILTTSPLFSALFAFLFYGEMLSFPDIFAGLLILGGIVIVVKDPRQWGEGDGGGDGARSGGRKMVGVAAGFLGSLGQSLGLIFSKYSLVAGDSPLEINVYRIAAGLAAMVLFLTFRGSLVSDFKKMQDRRALFLIAFGALIGPSLGVLAALYAVLFIPVGLSAVLMQTTPIMLLPFEKFLFGRRISPISIVGTLVSLAGIGLLILR